MASDPGRSGRWSYGASNARAWIQRHPVLGDLLVPVALGALTVRPATGRLAGDAAGLWLSAAACLIPLVWRRDHPIIVFALVTAAAVATAAADFKSLGVTAAGALLVALFTVGAHEPRRRALIAAVIFEAWAVPAIILWSPADAKIPGILLITGTGIAAVMTGVNLQTRRAYLAALEDRAARLENEQDQQARLAVASERTRIAREVHDIVTHSLSVMVALADGATAAVAASPERAREAMHQVSATGRQAIGEMRRMVDTLRIDEADVARHPAPGLAQLDDLLAQVRAAGLPARLTVEGQPHHLTAGAQLAVYRIVQESLTNIRKHAPAATSAAVRLRFSDDGIEVEITDDGPPAGGQLPAPGHGLAGMRERAAAYGGTIDAGPGVRGGWRVHGWLGRAGIEEPS
jgi:signal transduction histidine kinase